MGDDTNSVLFRILRNWWVVALVAILVIGLAAWQLSTSTTRYSATAFAVISPNASLQPSDSLRAMDLLTAPSTTATIADVLSRRVAGQALTTAEVTGTERQRYDITVTSEPDSNVLRIAVEGSDPGRTSAVAAAMLQNGQTTIDQYYPLFALNSLEASNVGAVPVGLSWPRTMALAIGLALGIGVLAALWVDSLRNVSGAWRRRLAPRGASLAEEHEVARGAHVTETTSAGG